MPFAWLPDELRLLCAVLLNALVLLSAWRLTRRFEFDRIQRACDALLVFYLVQYLAICVPGLVGALSPLTMVAAAVGISIGMALAGWKRSRGKLPFDPPIAATILFVLGYLTALMFHQRQLPVISNDALTYHLPAAVQWLQTGRLGLYHVWFYNPANSYSPLAGSAFIAWLLAPMGNDVLARFVQAGPFIFLFAVVLNVSRRAGMSTTLAAFAAATVVLARPFVSQTILAKDDLFVAAFFLALLAGCSPEALTKPFAPWRVGIALGLLLATKYTMLFSVPILLLLLDAPLRAQWRIKRWLVAMSVTILLAGPWYLRNWILTANPLYPTDISLAGATIFRGMLHVRRSALLGSPAGIWNIFTNGYYGIPIALVIPLLIGYVLGLATARRESWRDPLRRAILLGPVIGIGFFILAAPYGEMRFAYPAVALLFIAAMAALTRLPRRAQLAAGAALALLAAATAFRIEMSGPFILAGAVAASVALLWWRLRALAALRVGVPAAAVVAAGIAMLIGMYEYVRFPKDMWLFPWQQQYGAVADAWGFVRYELPPDATIAYANTYFTYPLMGFNFRHRVTYAPTRHDLDDFLHLPRIEQPLTGEQITARIGAMLRDRPDRQQWLRRLKASGASYLIVAKQDPAAPGTSARAPELDFAARDPVRFQRLFENDAAVVFKMNP